MNMNEFLEDVMNNLKSKLGEEFELSVRKVTKNNGIVLTALNIRKEGDSIVPTIYMEGFYRLFETGSSIEYIAENILKNYFDAENDKLTIDISTITDWNNVKDRLCVRVISEERNTDMLDEMVWKDYLDLAVIPVIVFQSSDEKMQSIKVTMDIAERWGVDYDTIINTGISNTKTMFPCTARNLSEVVGSLMGCDMDDIPDCHMKVVTNACSINGAAAILDDELLQEIYEEFDGTYYIIPSSIHELIVIPSGICEPDEIKNLVRQVNSTEVRDDEVLSDNVYIYDGSSVDMV